MCFAIPGQTYDRRGVRMATVRFGGVTRETCVEYLPQADVGSFVLMHVGFAPSVIDAEAERTYKLLEQMNQLGELGGEAADRALERPYGELLPRIC
jgi:hydrogenase expression/formation protein HypC